MYKVRASNQDRDYLEVMSYGDEWAQHNTSIIWVDTGDIASGTGRFAFARYHHPQAILVVSPAIHVGAQARALDDFKKPRGSFTCLETIFQVTRKRRSRSTNGVYARASNHGTHNRNVVGNKKG